MRRILFLLFISMVFIGSVTQTYHQTVSESGSSMISQELDATVFAQFMPEGTLSSMASVCLLDKELYCSIDAKNSIILISREFEENGNYYSFNAEYGIPYVDYTVTVTKVPKDVFSGAMEKIIAETGIRSEGSAGSPIDLTDAQKGRTLSDSMKNFNIDILYKIEMPGGITSAKAGEIEAKVEDSVAIFSLSEVLANASPLVVKSRQINWLYLFGIAGILAVVVLATSFLGKKRKTTSSSVKGTRVARPMPQTAKKTAKKTKKAK